MRVGGAFTCRVELRTAFVFALVKRSTVVGGMSVTRAQRARNVSLSLRRADTPSVITDLATMGCEAGGNTAHTAAGIAADARMT